MKRDSSIAIVRGQWNRPSASIPFGSMQAAFLIINAIANSGRYKNIDLYDEEVFSGTPGQIWENVSSDVFKVDCLSNHLRQYNLVYVSFDPMRYISHALRPINDCAPIVSEVGTSHYDSQWQNYFLARIGNFIRPTDGIIFKSVRTRSLFEMIWSGWDTRFQSKPFPISSVILNGVEPKMNQRDPALRSETRKFFGLNENHVVFLAFSRLAPSTKIDYESLVVLWKKIVEKNPNAALLLAGSIVTYPNHIDFQHRLRTLSRELGIANNVIVLGNPYDLWPNAKTNLMSAADVFIHTTKGVEETSSLVVLEAMAHELPVIVSNWSGFSEIIANGVNGFVIDTWSSDVLPVLSQMFSSQTSSDYNGKLESHIVCSPRQIFESVLLLAKDEQMRTAMGGKAKQDILNLFSIEKIVRKRLEFFDFVSSEAQKDWKINKKLHIKTSPLIETNLIPRGLSNHTIEYSTKVCLGDPYMLDNVPEIEDKNFREISQRVVNALATKKELSAEQLTALIWSDHYIKGKIEDVWPYLGLVLTRLLSYQVIEFI